ncbi:uncharacterized protein J8A68_000980 [[Candida] subhashii]|uniref:Major facilitator superfamily (MFS) profile domain-containing protein n=1 Tax=[Candida] subhashii TaxID=561895 RepID=A0A8J5QPS5_9ASCO|nr:uncharacterized protein J8A68_000980 [[Candida] subhashii]KAG7665578.1 hypothetical protein J8A68_000980 [[Candida] subhashii]
MSTVNPFKSAARNETIETTREEFEIVETPKPFGFRNPPKNIFRLFTGLIWAFGLGLSDGSVGVLLNYIQKQYNITYSVASTLWLSNALGYIIVAIFSDQMNRRWGRKSIFFGNISSIIMYSLVSTGSKYPVIVLGFFFGGLGGSACVSQYNVFMGRLEKSSTALGYLHGSYGLGASVAPLIATAFVEAGLKWNYYYLVVLGIFFLSSFNSYFSFVHDQNDLKAWDEVPIGEESENKGLMRESLKNVTTWVAALFVFFYQGAEVAFGGWITTYLRDYRNHNNTSIGYVASGYWFGLTFGRLVLTRLIHKVIGARRGNSILIVCSIVFAMLTWIISSLPIEIVTITFAGITIGPIYPLMITYVVSEGLLPRKIAVISLTVMTAFGSSGGAILPFVVGLISQFRGTYVVLPSFIAMFIFTLVLWLMLPNSRYSKGSGKGDIFRRIW